jgi:branched-chain amino acid transport system substrate-binding protein
MQTPLRPGRRRLALAGGAAQAQITDGVIKIGVMNDMSGLYADIAGPGSVLAAKMAVEDFGAAGQGHEGRDRLGRPPEQARRRLEHRAQWYDVDKVDAVVDVPTSSVALAVNQITKDKNKVFLNSGAATSDLTGKACSPNTVHWTYDTWMLANGTGKRHRQDRRRHLVLPDRRLRLRPRARARHRGGGQGKSGGKVLGKVRHPLPGQDFSSFLLQAQASKAKIIGLANAGGDTINSIKQAAEFGITKGGQNLAGLLVFITDVHALGLKTAQGLIFTESLLLGPERPDPRLDQALRGRQKAARCRRWCRPASTASVIHYLKAVEGG